MIYLPPSVRAIEVLPRKAVDLQTEESKALYWRSFERLRTGFYKAVEHQVKARFEAERKEVLRSLRGLSPDGAMAAIEATLREQRPEWDKLITATYLDVGEAFAPRVIAQVTGSKSRKSDDAWKDFILQWLRVQAGLKVSQIESTTLEQLRRALSEGVDQGEGIREISRRISELYEGTIEPWRSTMIARTEVISASNAASVAGARSTSIPMEKEWLSTRDDRTRDSHRDMDGQRVGMEDPFSVSGWGMQWPGDSSLGAPPDELINCRCTVVYRRL